MEDTLLVSFVNPKNDDTSVLLVGRKSPKQDTQIVNAFQGREAIDIYNKLVTMVKKTEGDVSE